MAHSPTQKSPTQQDIIDKTRKRNLYTAYMYNSQKEDRSAPQQSSTPGFTAAQNPTQTTAQTSPQQSTDYSLLIRDAMAAGADADTVQGLLDARVAKATADPALNKYAFDDVYKSGVDYINSSRFKSSSMASSLNAPQRQPSYYEPNYRAVLEEARNYQPFNYNVEGDPAYQAYAKLYRREGDRAAQNALAGAAGMTGGIPSSYAVGAATQAGSYYASQLSDKIPELYQQAYNRYLQEYSRRLGLADYYRQGMNDEESRYLSDVNRYNTDRNFAYGAYRDELSDAERAETTEYNRTLAAQQYQDELAAAQAKAAYQQQQDDLDRSKWLAEFDADQANKAFANAIKVSDMLGYVPEQYAGILGVPAGTSTADAAYKALKGTKDGRDSNSDVPTYDKPGNPVAGSEPAADDIVTVKYNYNEEPDSRYTSSAATSVDYDENSGIIRWNGTDFRSLENLEQALMDSYNDGLITDDDFKEIIRKLKMYGFKVEIIEDEE